MIQCRIKQIFNTLFNKNSKKWFFYVTLYDDSESKIHLYFNDESVEKYFYELSLVKIYQIYNIKIVSDKNNSYRINDSKLIFDSTISDIYEIEDKSLVKYYPLKLNNALKIDQIKTKDKGSVVSLNCIIHEKEDLKESDTVRIVVQLVDEKGKIPMTFWNHQVIIKF